MSMESAVEPGQDLEPRNGGVLRKCFLFGFATAVTVGLALASWYVGVRVVAADQAIATRTPARHAPSPADEEKALADAYWYLTPPDGSLYLQLSGFGADQAARTLSELEAKGYRARLETNTGGHLRRIVVGPFPDRTALEQAQRSLRSGGMITLQTAP